MHQWLAKRRLAKLVRQGKARNAAYTANRNAQLTPERKARIRRLVGG